mmetsp:Transcript_37650/g.124237  ORF Transcript_37650/g.124237 Transcript_37650/m.124237 type:complete len:274 (+) Transcript_37650:103-924(+)
MVTPCGRQHGAGSDAHLPEHDVHRLLVAHQLHVLLARDGEVHVPPPPANPLLGGRQRRHLLPPPHHRVGPDGVGVGAHRHERARHERSTSCVRRVRVESDRRVRLPKRIRSLSRRVGQRRGEGAAPRRRGAEEHAAAEEGGGPLAHRLRDGCRRRPLEAEHALGVGAHNHVGRGAAERGRVRRAAPGNAEAEQVGRASPRRLDRYPVQEQGAEAEAVQRKRRLARRGEDLVRQPADEAFSLAREVLLVEASLDWEGAGRERLVAPESVARQVA